jgi:single-stranded-DNA-specific exonuclease
MGILMKEKWMVKNKSADFKAIAGHFGISEVTARLLVNRGLNDFEAMGCYLAPDISQLHDPQGMKDAGKAAGILAEKISEGKKIRIIGDYDVDGVVATYIFMETLLECGADVDYRIPERVRDGYGLNLRLVEEAAADGVDTILTCDNGIAAVEQVDFAKECGMCVVVTDHHELQEQLPKADALVNPKQMDCSYPYKGLCGAAVAYKVAELIYGACGKEKGSAEKFIAFAAIATVCDVMELTGENRTIVSLGLAALRSSTHCGIQALCAANGITGEALDTYRLGFVLGPCINATGRLETAERGVKLLLSKDGQEAQEIAEKLKELNEIRRDMTAKGVQAAVKIVEEKGEPDRVLVVFLEDCHESLAGIIAGRLRERYNRPAIVLTRTEGGLKGSGRSTGQYSMFEKLTECREMLKQYGGHPMAAGLSLAEENYLPLVSQLNERCGLTEEDLTLKISIDAVLALTGLSFSLVEELNRLEPFGKGNEKPVFAERGLKLHRMTAIGKGRKMFRFLVEDAYGTQMDALYFGDGEVLEEEMIARYGEDVVRGLYGGVDMGVRMSVVYYPSINEYRDKRTLQIVLQHIMWQDVE